jgi:hypothetical protein
MSDVEPDGRITGRTIRELLHVMQRRTEQLKHVMPQLDRRKAVASGGKLNTAPSQIVSETATSDAASSKLDTATSQIVSETATSDVASSKLDTVAS